MARPLPRLDVELSGVVVRPIGSVPSLSSTCDRWPSQRAAGPAE